MRVTPAGGTGEKASSRTIDPRDGWTVEPLDEHTLRLRDAAGRSHLAALGERRAATARGAPTIEVVVDGWRFELDVEDEARATLRERASRDRDAATTGGSHEIRAIIPGRVVSVAVTPGDEVSLGDRVLVLEAMKMQNELRAPRAGTVRRVGVGEGDTVEIGDVLLVIE